jgi:hypothetical protein
LNCKHPQDTGFNGCAAGISSVAMAMQHQAVQLFLSYREKLSWRVKPVIATITGLDFIILERFFFQSPAGIIP